MCVCVYNIDSYKTARTETTVKYTDKTPMIITTDTINSKTVKGIIAGMYSKVIRFVQDGNCGWARVQEFDGSSKWVFVATTEAAQMMTGAS